VREPEVVKSRQQIDTQSLRWPILEVDTLFWF
jgi:hypothetical protein